MIHRPLEDEIQGAAHTAPEPKKEGQDEAIGRSKGGLSTKIHATTDALGNPTRFMLTPGQAHDLNGADGLLPDLEADALLADKAYDADERVLDLLQKAGKTAIIPSKRNRKEQRDDDKDLYKARHLIERLYRNAIPNFYSEKTYAANALFLQSRRNINRLEAT